MTASPGELRALSEALEGGSWADVIRALQGVKTGEEIEVELCASPRSIARWLDGGRMRPSVEKSMRKMVSEWVGLSKPEPTRQQLLDRIAELEAGLEPFGGVFAETFVDDEGWTGPMSKERIVDWFGPSDFRRARSLLSPSQQEGKGNG